MLKGQRFRRRREIIDTEWMSSRPSSFCFLPYLWNWDGNPLVSEEDEKSYYQEVNIEVHSQRPHNFYTDFKFASTFSIRKWRKVFFAALLRESLSKLGLLRSAKDLESLKNIVTTIQAVLLDSEEQQARNNSIEVWLENLTDAFYEADSLLDDFSAEFLQQEIMTRDKKAEKVSIFFSKSNQIAYLLKTGHKIKAIIEKVRCAYGHWFGL